jgi:hypothetical protein
MSHSNKKNFDKLNVLLDLNSKISKTGVTPSHSRSFILPLHEISTHSLRLTNYLYLFFQLKFKIEIKIHNIYKKSVFTSLK